MGALEKEPKPSTDYPTITQDEDPSRKLNTEGFFQTNRTQTRVIIDNPDGTRTVIEQRITTLFPIKRSGRSYLQGADSASKSEQEDLASKKKTLNEGDRDKLD